MNQPLSITALCIGMALLTGVHAEISIVNVKKVEHDLYKTSDGQYIETRFCHMEADGASAVLDYVKYACHNNLQFSPDESCKVEFVFK